MKPLNYPNLLKTVGFSLVTFSIAGCSTAKQEQETEENRKPNVLFIAVDDLRNQAACFGDPIAITPNIDRIAAEGTQFNRSYCQVPVSGASRASLLSGIRPTPDRFVTYFTRLDEDVPGTVSLPGHFKNNGYYTISNGKVFHHADDNVESWSKKAWEAPGKKGNWRDYVTQENIAKEIESKSGAPYEWADVPDTAYRDGRIAARTIADLQRIAEQLSERGYSTEDVEGIMHGNWIRFLREAWN